MQTSNEFGGASFEKRILKCWAGAAIHHYPSPNTMLRVHRLGPFLVFVLYNRAHCRVLTFNQWVSGYEGVKATMGGGGGGVSSYSRSVGRPLAGRPAGWCRPCLALCLHATEPHIAHVMLMEQFFLNNICWKLFVLLSVTCNAPFAIVLDNALPASTL